MNALIKVVILVPCLCYFVGLADTATTECVFGTHKSLPGESCKHILHVQPVCFGRSGFFWVKTGSDIDYVYCDMYHKGGGWRRVVYWHGASTGNTTCPGSLTHTNHNGKHFCSRNPLNRYYDEFSWNYNQEVSFSEIRGYFILKVEHGSQSHGFENSFLYKPEDRHMDGVDIVIGTSANAYIRTIFAYAISSSNAGLGSCPSNGGFEYHLFQRNYRDYHYACDVHDISSPSNYPAQLEVLQDFFVNSSCVQCPAGAPWFEVRYANALPLTRMYIRIVNADAWYMEGLILATDFEIYVR